ncbi:hypothetical protein AB0I16_17385 [Streptomyces sp. NPDC050703]|uniref:hypothetical protein n=1 Tax=Streptomyces sp. NPDC050703 TaxID=3157218 RepID=UPI0034132ECF
MSHTVLALGAAVLFASGCVWYVPATLDLRAGADRPDSRRASSWAALAGWGTAALLIPLLLLTSTWPVPGVTVATGALVTAVLAVRARRVRRREESDDLRRWATLSRAPAPAPAPVAVPVLVPAPVSAPAPAARHAHHTVLAWLLTGTATATATAATLLASRNGSVSARMTTAGAASTAVALLFLAGGYAWSRIAREPRG